MMRRYGLGRRERQEEDLVQGSCWEAKQRSIELPSCRLRTSRPEAESRQRLLSRLPCASTACTRGHHLKSSEWRDQPSKRHAEDCGSASTSDGRAGIIPRGDKDGQDELGREQ